MMRDLLGILLTILTVAVSVGAARADGELAEPSPEEEAALIEATVLEAPQDPDDAKDLPEFDQAAIVSKQRARLGTIKTTLRLRMVASESDHFLLFSDLNTQVRQAILIWLEELRTKLITQLGVDPAVRLWDGKCVAVVFAKQEFLAAFAGSFDNHHLQRPRGYFVLEGRRPNAPRLVHIAAYQPLRGGNRALREVLVHETTHAIVELYQRSAPLPLWVHEGLAEYMTLLMDPTLRATKQAPAFKVATAIPYTSIEPVFASVFPSSNIAAYSVSMSLVECLYAIKPAGVLHFVELLKQGVDPDDALAQAYDGLDTKELERRWKTFCMRFYRPAVQDAVAP